MKSTLFPLAIYLAYVTAVFAGEHFINGKVYYFEDNPKYYTWHEALDFCHNRGVGFELVSIETVEENIAIKDVIAANYDTNNYWLGASRDVNNTWTWRNGLPVSVWDWGPGEPTNNLGEDFLMMSAGSWQDCPSDNDDQQRALCEAY